MTTVTGQAVREPKRTPQKHEVQCKSCRHPEREEVEALWCSWRLSDATAADWLGCSERAWRRHAAYTEMYSRRARGSTALYQRIIELGLKAGEDGRATLGDALRAAVMLAETNQRERPAFSLQAMDEWSDKVRRAVSEGLIPADVLEGH